MSLMWNLLINNDKMSKYLLLFPTGTDALGKVKNKVDFQRLPVSFMLGPVSTLVEIDSLQVSMV